MRVRYVGESFGVDGLTNGAVYSVLNVGVDEIRIVDDSGGRWEFFKEDDEKRRD